MGSCVSAFLSFLSPHAGQHLRMRMLGKVKKQKNKTTGHRDLVKKDKGTKINNDLGATPGGERLN
jgi:hypothetical protein